MAMYIELNKAKHCRISLPARAISELSQSNGFFVMGYLVKLKNSMSMSLSLTYPRGNAVVNITVTNKAFKKFMMSCSQRRHAYDSNIFSSVRKHHYHLQNGKSLILPTRQLVLPRKCSQILWGKRYLALAFYFIG
jgi:hypothetical protein